jgi:membrane-associated protein
MFDFLHHVDLTAWISTLGYFGLILIIFLETGVFFGFFLPGDSLLFVSGVLAAQGVFNIFILIPVLVLTAFLGYAFGYWFGFRLGHWLMARKESFWFRKRYIESAKVFYARHGRKTLILGRFVPVIRTFIPIVGGMAEMPLRKYLLFNAIGALLWALGLPLLGYFLGDIIPDAGKYIVPIVLFVIFLSILPAIYHSLKKRFSKKSL